MKIEPIPCLSDNYAYLIWRDGTREALVVDPSEHLPVLRVLEEKKLRLSGILCTHRHWDHIGGVKDLRSAFPGIPVFASDYDVTRIEGVTRGIGHQESFDCMGFHFDCLKVPGHTLGALAYCVADAVFTGDTLFGAGCGQLFEGTPAQMHASLMSLASLAPQTKVYFGHEYTRSNLAFARSIEPHNEAVQARLQRAAVPKNSYTAPSTVEEERATNPFLRCSEPSVKAALGAEYAEALDVEVFAEVRRRKDWYRG